jgi:threonine aldolase
MVFIEFAPARLDAFKAHAQDHAIRMSIGYLPSIRLVTHLDIDDAAIDRTIEVMRGFFR